jgi:hypothetical protein
MNKKLVVISSVAIVGAVTVIVWARSGDKPHHPRPHATSGHANGIDGTDSSVSLMTIMNAPEGATPCESAYNAFEAEQAALRLRGGRSMFEWVAPRADFLAACQSLTAVQQNCMAPRYRRDHEAECGPARPPDAQLAKMFIAYPVVEEKLPGEE